MESFVMLVFGGEGEARRALGGLRELHHGGAVEANEAALVERTPSGDFVILDNANFGFDACPANGSLARILVGVLGGPVGMLMGFLAGGRLGAHVDVARETATGSALHGIAERLQRGSVGLMAAVCEPSPEPLDRLSEQLGAALWRVPAEVLQLAIENAIAADKAARAAARTTLRAEWRQQPAASWSLFKQHLCAKLHVKE
jgi:hypothetical protein